MTQFSESQLEHLKSRLFPFGAEWTSRTGRELASVRDGIDFLSDMKSRDEFWAALAPATPTDAYPIDLAALRTLLPAGTLAADVTAEDYLRSLGLSEAEVGAVVSDLDAPDFFESAIRSAFAEGRPQSIARALERLLDTNSDIVATQCYVGRVAGSRGIVRTISAMMGIALLLVGAACGPQSSQPSPTPPSAQQTTPAPTPAPTPDPKPTPAPVSVTVEAPTPAPPAAPTTATTPTPRPDPVRPPRPSRPNRPPEPATRYKGVSPRRRAAKPSTTSKRGVSA